MRVVAGVLIALLFAVAAYAAPKDYIEATGELTDDDFYRLVSCAAPVGKACTRPVYRWLKRDITVSLVHSDRAFLGKKVKRAEASIVRAVEQINSVDFPIRLRILPAGSAADMSIYLMDTPRKAVLRSRQFPELNGTYIGNASTRIIARGRIIVRTEIIFSRDLPMWAYQSVMLEELTQSLGLLTDIKNPYYEKRSIFTQSGGNHRKKLSYKDRMSLRRHYR